jgi:hypothetical protein
MIGKMIGKRMKARRRGSKEAESSRVKAES